MIEALPLLAWPLHRSALTILVYHRVLPVADPLRPGEVVAPTFDRQMRLLSRACSVLPLREAIAALGRGTLPARACCITFDDGYADNLTVALPILERYRLPATVFVATGYLDGGLMFNDAVIEAVARAPGTTLDLRELGWGLHSIAGAEQRRTLVGTLLARFRYLAPGERDAAVTDLVARVDSGPLPRDLMLTSGQVGELARRGVEIGGHTVAHNILTTLDDDRARGEIGEGKLRLEALTGKAVSVFAYPNGRPWRDYAGRHAAMLRELGFEAAVTTAHGVARRGFDPYQLPRFTPWGSSTTMLAARLTRNAWNGKPTTC